jgi:sporulation protein YlmC with PRC-barrel domain
MCQTSNKDADKMKRATLCGSLALSVCLGFAAPVLADEPVVTGTATTHAASGDSAAPVAKPAASCLNDLHALHDQMKKDGYWLGASSDAYGYPIGEGGYYGYAMAAFPSTAETRYPDVRPGYEVRTLLAAANILARHGLQQPCEDVLATTRNIYAVYVADMRVGGTPRGVEGSGWQLDEIAGALPVTNNSRSFRSDQLIGTDVRTVQNEALGSVDDLVMNPATGKIAYLVIARGGIFGIGEKYIPVPFADFKITPKADLLVLDASRSSLSGAPEVSHDQSMTTAQFDQESPKVDAYWKTHLSAKSN